MKLTLSLVEFMLVYVYVLFNFIDVSFSETNINNCIEPDNLLKMATKLERNNINFHNSYYLLDPLRTARLKKDRYYRNVLSNYRSALHMSIYGNRECPKYLQPSNKTMVNMCPVFFELSHDVSRVPKAIVQARCACKKCLLREGEDALKDRMPQYECRPVFYYEPVLRRIGCDENRVYIYKPVIEPIKVGCQCALSIIT